MADEPSYHSPRNLITEIQIAAPIKRRLRGLAAVALLFSLSPIESLRAAPAMPPDAPADSWSSFVQRFTEEYFAANPPFAVYQGRHEFDGRLPDWSETGLQAQIARLKRARADALGFRATVLSRDEAFERDYLVATIRRDLFWLETADFPHVNPAFYADALDPSTYVSREYAPLTIRLEAYTRYARALPGALEQIKANLRGPLAKPLIAIAKITIGGLASFYEQEVPAIFAAPLQRGGPTASEFAAANAGAIKAVREFSAWLEAREATAPPNFALGPDKFRAMLRETEGVDISLAELEAIGRKDLQRNTAALRAECAKFAPGLSVREAMDRVKQHKPTGSVVAAAATQLTELKRFVLEHKVVSVPGPEEAKVAESPAYRRWNFAYINIPGPYENGLPSVYYVAPPDPSWPQAKREAYVPGVASLLFTSVHEVWPGHFLQYLHANRAPSKFGQVFVGYAFSEGWAHYSEEMMWDMGLGAGSPEIHIGQLGEALLRNARFLVAIGLHTKGMTAAEATKLFVDQGFTDEGTAEQQARRGVFDPAFLNYTMGKLMIRKLRDDWCATRGGQAAWKQFHDEFLRYGGPPVPLVRRAMLGADKANALF
jgi:uncharacterized protein (DUF885 family)